MWHCAQQNLNWSPTPWPGDSDKKPETSRENDGGDRGRKRKANLEISV